MYSVCQVIINRKMSSIPGAYCKGSIAAGAAYRRRYSTNVFSTSRRLSPHADNSSSTLMSLYSVQTDLTTSSVESIRRRFFNFNMKQNKRYKETMATTATAISQSAKKVSIRPPASSLPRLPKITNEGIPPGVSNEIFPDQNWPTKRYFTKHNKESLNEWDIMKDCDRGKSCLWNGVHRHVLTSLDYNSRMHRPDVLHAQRNGIPEASKGDKSYQTPEFSAGFHKQGSTRPIANFGGIKKELSDTHIPLVEPYKMRKSFVEKEQDRQRWEDMTDVEELELWRPATPLQWRPSKNITRADQLAALQQLQQTH